MTSRAVRLRQIGARLAFLQDQKQKIREQLPELEADLDYADKHDTAPVWYRANVRVNEARRELKRIDKEAGKLERERARLVAERKEE